MMARAMTSAATGSSGCCLTVILFIFSPIPKFCSTLGDHLVHFFERAASKDFTSLLGTVLILNLNLVRGTDSFDL
jgi:hypothetical protein